MSCNQNKHEASKEDIESLERLFGVRKRDLTLGEILREKRMGKNGSLSEMLKEED